MKSATSKVYVVFNTKTKKINRLFSPSFSKRELKKTVEYSRRCADTGTCQQCAQFRDGVLVIRALSPS